MRSNEARTGRSPAPSRTILSLASSRCSSSRGRPRRDEAAQVAAPSPSSPTVACSFMRRNDPPRTSRVPTAVTVSEKTSTPNMMPYRWAVGRSCSPNAARRS